MTPCMGLQGDYNAIYEIKNIKFDNSKKFSFKNEFVQAICTLLNNTSHGE
jgi:hypothetical protein